MNITVADLGAIAPGLIQEHPQSLRLLNIGAGMPAPERLPECFRSERWQEIRLDIDERLSPDILGDAANLSSIHNASFDAVYSSHNLEHLEGHAVPKALSEMHRVLRPGGVAIITLPNLERIAQLILEGRLTQVMYTSPAGPITPLDMLFGHQRAIQSGNAYMAHRTGFTAKNLQDRLAIAGFSQVRVRAGDAYDLWAIAVK